MKRYFPIILLFVCAVSLVLGIVQLFALRFEVGDVYPEYSSLRSDPLGTMALFDSLERLPELSVRRDFSTSNHLPAGADTTYLHIAASISSLQQISEEALKEIERFASEGGRLVITMFPASARRPSQPPSDPKAKVAIRERWGVDFLIVDLQHFASAYEPAYVESADNLPLPDSLDWHSGIVLSNSEDWTPVYLREADAVAIERHFGRGSVVIATDSYFVSNEAMLRDRHADLLAWLIGPNRNVVFDEAHLGVTESPGVATLMRKYRLEWFAAGLILLAGLFIWKNSTSLVPAHAETQTQDYVAGKTAAAGFDNLLRRSISARELLGTCFAEWKKSVSPGGKYSNARIKQAEAAFQTENSLAARERDSVKAYQTISRILHKKSHEH